MEVKLGETAYFDFATSRFDTGAASDADSTPTVSVYEDTGTTSVYSVSVGKIGTNTGEYRATVVATSGNGFESGKTYNVWAFATVNSVVGKGVIGRFIVRGKSLDDLSVLDEAGIRTATGLATANLDTQLAAIVTDTGTTIPAVLAGLSTLDGADIRTAVGLATANLDTQLGAVPTATENADALLARDLGSETGEGTLNERTVRSALRWLRNKWGIVAGVLTVYKENDSDAAWTSVTTGDAGASPIVSSDPS